MAQAAPEASPLPIAPGTVIAEKYRVDGMLGQGAMGVVVAATPLAGGAPVAIKLLLPDALEQTEALARFQREIHLVRQLQSEHVARIIDAGSHGDGAPYMAIEYLAGHDLSHELASQGPLPVATAVDWVLQALDALTEAHVAGIIHRDLKPSNLFLASRPDGSRSIKVLDFGISKQRVEGDQGVSLTKTHSLIGSPLYMSPEQILAAKDVDARSDLWSIGAVLFELLAGATPFDGANVGMVLTNVLSAPLPSLRQLRPDAPAALEAVLARCLERPAQRRYPSGVALARALAPFASPAGQALVGRIERFAKNFPEPAEEQPPDTLPGGPGSRPSTLTFSNAITERPPPTDPAPTDAPSPAPPSRRGPLVALALVLLMLGAAALAARFGS